MDVIHSVLDAITNLGSLPFVLIVLVFMLAVGPFNLFLDLLFAWLGVFILIAIIKLIFFKRRPERKGDKSVPSSFVDRIDQSTFPSFHSANATMLAIMLSLTFHNVWLSIFLTALALLVMASRIHLKKHYLLDVSVGSAIGIIASVLVIWIGNAMVFLPL